MPTIHLEFNVPRESLLKAIEQLGPMELDELVAEVLALQARRTTAALPSGIVSCYKAEDNADDAAGNHNGAAVATTYGPGLVGRAFQFDGEGYVRVPDAPSLNSPAITVEAWVKGTTTQGRYRYLVAKGVHADEAASYGLYTGCTGGLFFYVYDRTLDAALSPARARESGTGSGTTSPARLTAPRSVSMLTAFKWEMERPRRLRSTTTCRMATTCLSGPSGHMVRDRRTAPGASLVRLTSSRSLTAL